MIKYTDECVDCGLTCLGRDCPNKRVAHYKCDYCGEEVDELRKYKGKHICPECYCQHETHAKCKICECDDEPLLYVDGQYICFTCAWENLEEVIV